MDKGVKTNKKLPIVEILWKDSQSFSKWTHEEEMENCEAVDCYSAGYLYSQDKKETKIYGMCVPDVENGNTYNQVFIIPTGCIVSMKEIRRK